MEDVVVCLKHESIVWLDGGLVAIETVRVHHSELTAANKTISGANLVTILVGDVVQVERQFLVGMALTTDNRRDQFLVCRSQTCLLYTSPSPRDGLLSRMPSSA